MTIDIQKLIDEGEEISKTLVKKEIPQSGLYGDLYYKTIYTTPDEVKYQTWINSVRRVTLNNYSQESQEYKNINGIGLNPKNMAYMVGLLCSIKNIPLSTSQTKEPSINLSLNSTNINHNNNTQNQNLTIEVFIDIIKDELTGVQLKELNAILKNHKDEPETAKSKVVEKLKSFGSDLISNILANIITTPSVWSGFM